MGKIFYIMGKSASGKDRIYSILSKDESLGLKRLVLYTTRPIRAGEENGREYYFTDENRLEEFRKTNRLIESRAYHTVHGIWKIPGMQKCAAGFWQIRRIFRRRISLQQVSGSGSKMMIWIIVSEIL